MNIEISKLYDGQLSTNGKHKISVEFLCGDQSENAFIKLVYAETKEDVEDKERHSGVTHKPLSGEDYENGVRVEQMHASFEIRVHSLSSQHGDSDFCFAVFSSSSIAYSDPFRTLSKIRRVRTGDDSNS